MAANTLVGKAGRDAHVLSLTRPSVAGLCTALAGSLQAKADKAREAPPDKVACRRFGHGTRMLLRILGFADRKAPVPNSRDAWVVRPSPHDPSVCRIESDAPPWGGWGHQRAAGSLFLVRLVPG